MLVVMFFMGAKIVKISFIWCLYLLVFGLGVLVSFLSWEMIRLVSLSENTEGCLPNFSIIK
jgi:hypothetical protein